MKSIEQLAAVLLLSSLSKGAFDLEDESKIYKLRSIREPVIDGSDRLTRFHFIARMRDFLIDMPMPDDPDFLFIRKGKHLHACNMNEATQQEQIDSEYRRMEVPSARELLQLVHPSMVDRCTKRLIDGYMYQVCGSTVVSRSRPDRPRDMEDKTIYGQFATDPRLSTHRPTVANPTYVQHTFHGGSMCKNLTRPWTATVSYQCSPGIQKGFSHIHQVSFQTPCHAHFRMFNGDLCSHGWASMRFRNALPIQCRKYIHPSRLERITQYFPLYKQKLREDFEDMLLEAEYGGSMSLDEGEEDEGWKEVIANRTHGRMILMYKFIVSELVYATANPEKPYTDEEYKKYIMDRNASRQRHRTMIENMLDHIYEAREAALDKVATQAKHAKTEDEEWRLNSQLRSMQTYFFIENVLDYDEFNSVRELFWEHMDALEYKHKENDPDFYSYLGTEYTGVPFPIQYPPGLEQHLLNFFHRSNARTKASEEKYQKIKRLIKNEKLSWPPRKKPKEEDEVESVIEKAIKEEEEDATRYQ